MKIQGIFPVILVGTLVLTGCNQANREMGTATDEQQTRTAAVRESDGDMNQSNMSDQMQQCRNMMTQHLGNADAEYDKRFIDMMIPHHEGAIQMAKDAQQKAQHPEIKKMAQEIIDAQQKEIRQLEQWRKQWYGSSASQ